MQTFKNVLTSFGKYGSDNYCYNYYTVVARTKADAIIECQKRLANAFNLSRSDQSLVRCEFEPE